MTILAVCPYCKTGKIRAPRSALGMSATCPRCSNCFTIADTEEIKPNAAKKPVVGRFAPTEAAAPASEAVTTQPRPPSPTSADDEWNIDPSESLVAARSESAAADFRDARPGSAGLAVALVALLIAGLAFGSTQIPVAGRIAAAVLGAIGLAFGLLALVTCDGRWRLPAAGSALNALCLLLVLLLPDWVNLGPWWPETIEDDSHLVKTVPFKGGGATIIDGEWVDASKGAWQQNDVRVTISGVRAGRTEIVGAKGQREWSKDRLLVIGVRIANVGVVRPVQYRSWHEPPPPEGLALRVTMPDGTALVPAKPPAGYGFPNRIKSADLFPTKSADDVLIFELPKTDVEYIRIELPGWGIEAKDPVKIHVPRSMIVSTK